MNLFVEIDSIVNLNFAYVFIDKKKNPALILYMFSKNKRSFFSLLVLSILVLFPVFTYGKPSQDCKYAITQNNEVPKMGFSPDGKYFVTELTKFENNPDTNATVLTVYKTGETIPFTTVTIPTYSTSSDKHFTFLSENPDKILWGYFLTGYFVVDLPLGQILSFNDKKPHILSGKSDRKPSQSKRKKESEDASLRTYIFSDKESIGFLEESSKNDVQEVALYHLSDGSLKTRWSLQSGSCNVKKVSPHHKKLIAKCSFVQPVSESRIQNKKEETSTFVVYDLDSGKKQFDVIAHSIGHGFLFFGSEDQYLAFWTRTLTGMEVQVINEQGVIEKKASSVVGEKSLQEGFFSSIQFLKGPLSDGGQADFLLFATSGTRFIKNYIEIRPDYEHHTLVFSQKEIPSSQKDLVGKGDFWQTINLYDFAWSPYKKIWIGNVIYPNDGKKVIFGNARVEYWESFPLLVNEGGQVRSLKPISIQLGRLDPRPLYQSISSSERLGNIIETEEKAYQSGQIASIWDLSTGTVIFSTPAHTLTAWLSSSLDLALYAKAQYVRGKTKICIQEQIVP